MTFSNNKKGSIEKMKKPHTKNKRYLELCAKFVTEEHHRLFEVYKRPSKEKQKAYEKCRLEAIEHDAIIYGIISHNSFAFTFAYMWRSEYGMEITLILPTKKIRCLNEDVARWKK